MAAGEREARMATTTTPHLGIPDWGVDLRPVERPGIPWETAPHPIGGAHWTTPERQVPTVPVLKRADLPELTPVFSNAEPPHGLSGGIRRFAYTFPDHLASHWVLLILADRVDVVESDFGGFLRRAWPLVAVAAVGGLVIATRRQSRRRRRRH